jgi:hypothetical protein
MWSDVIIYSVHDTLRLPPHVLPIFILSSFHQFSRKKWRSNWCIYPRTDALHRTGFSSSRLFGTLYIYGSHLPFVPPLPMHQCSSRHPPCTSPWSSAHVEVCNVYNPLGFSRYCSPRLTRSSWTKTEWWPPWPCSSGWSTRWPSEYSSMLSRTLPIPSYAFWSQTHMHCISTIISTYILLWIHFVVVAADTNSVRGIPPDCSLDLNEQR